MFWPAVGLTLGAIGTAILIYIVATVTEEKDPRIIPGRWRR